jgi:Predicted membrane protein (DUF2232)
MLSSAQILVGGGGGVLAAVMYLTVAIGTPGALILGYMSQLPLFAAGLAKGVLAVGLAAALGTLIVGIATGFFPATMFLVMNAAPAVFLIRQSLLSRVATDGSGHVEWYPAGLLVHWLTVLALAAVTAGLIAITGIEELHEAIEGELRGVFEAFMPGAERARAAEMAETFAELFPGIAIASWMVMFLVNAALAQGALVTLKRNLRPSPRMQDIELPAWMAAVLGIGIVLMLVAPGFLDILGRNLLLAILVPYVLGGLSVAHLWARNRSVWWLVLFYAVMFVSGYLALLAAILGFADQWLKLKRRMAGSESVKEIK